MSNEKPIDIEEKKLLAQKIFPRNLTARADMVVTGNPVSTRLESGVGNCYPGLEYDHRNLDRRFFPGLVFEFVSGDSSIDGSLVRMGLSLVDVDLADPALREDPALRAALADNADALGEGPWFVDEIEQGGRKILTYTETDGVRTAFDGLGVVYNFVRGLVPGEVRILLSNRGSQPPAQVELTGRRRRYLSPDGVIGTVYQAGEMTQSLCSPWQHDFRDCACNYWASNHPDIVLTEDEVGEALLPSGASADSFRAQAPVDWLRADRNRESSAEALPTRRENRPFQMDHYEINRRWEQLAVVLEGKEISSIYYPDQADQGKPLGSPAEVANALKYLASLEHVLILEYLYAYFSIAPPGGADAATYPGLDDAVIFARHQLLMIAVSEMRHLRWANQVLWELEHAGLIPAGTGPALDVAAEVPAGKPPQKRPRELRILSPETLDDFIAVEAPSGTLDGQYAGVAATLREPPYPPSTNQLAQRIIADGVEHYSRFRELNLVLKNYQPADGALPYLRKLTPADPATEPDAKAALEAYRKIIANLAIAYGQGDMEDAGNILEARKAMEELDSIARRLAEKDLGVPFF